MMKKDVFAGWWRIDVTDSDMRILHWAVTFLIIFWGVSIISSLRAGEIVNSIPSLGFLILHVAYAIGPQCWGVIEAKEGSNSRKALTLIAMFGFFLALSGLIAKYM